MCRSGGRLRRLAAAEVAFPVLQGLIRLRRHVVQRVIDVVIEDALALSQNVETFQQVKKLKFTPAVNSSGGTLVVYLFSISRLPADTASSS